MTKNTVVFVFAAGQVFFKKNIFYMLFIIILCADIRNILLYFRAKYTLKSYRHHNTKHHLSLHQNIFQLIPHLLEVA